MQFSWKVLNSWEIYSLVQFQIFLCILVIYLKSWVNRKLFFFRRTNTKSSNLESLWLSEWIGSARGGAGYHGIQWCWEIYSTKFSSLQKHWESTGFDADYWYFPFFISWNQTFSFLLLFTWRTFPVSLNFYMLAKILCIIFTNRPTQYAFCKFHLQYCSVKPKSI